MDRYWINQPSTLQPDHKLHGVRVLADLATGSVARANNQTYVDVYFTNGEVSASRMSTLSLSPGWPKTSRHAPDKPCYRRDCNEPDCRHLLEPQKGISQ